tara:strand:+ start:116 stop:781 length:666 start_codon:yes stop_codon:yes gene_type:complete
MLNYSKKLAIFRIIRKFFKLFNLKIFYSKEINYLKELKIDTVIDVGVANGTKELLRNFPNSFFYFVEPNPIYWDFIEKKLLKKFKGILYKTAAGNKTGEEVFFDSGVISSFIQRQDFKFKNKISVKIDKLDNFLLNRKFKNTLLKIDTEGYELEVLKGSEKLLKNIDYCIIEVRLNNINTYNPSDLINFLYQRNFYFDKILKVYYAKYGIDFIDVLFKKNI